MNGEKADMVFTDQRYGMNLDTDFSTMIPSNVLQKTKGLKNGKKYEKVKGDNEDYKNELVTTIFENFDYCKEIFIWGADYFPELLKDYKKGNFIIWDKKSNKEVEESKFDKTYSSGFEVCWTKNKHKKEIVRCLWVSCFGTEQEFDHKRHHPTQKPTKLTQWFLDRYSKDNQSIVDLFGGSGSTLIACEQLNRKCYTMELDEHYCYVIITRWENLTGKKAELING
jgi:DNA modification methylase